MNISNSLKGAIAIIALVLGVLYFGKQSYDRASRLHDQETQQTPSSAETETDSAGFIWTVESGAPGQACTSNDAVKLQEFDACKEARLVDSAVVETTFGIALNDGKATLREGDRQLSEADCTDPSTVFRLCGITTHDEKHE